MIQLKFHYAPLSLSDFETFEDKVEQVIAYLEIYAIFCDLENGQIPDYDYTDVYNVIDIYIPGGSPASIKSLMIHCLPLLQEALEDFVKNHDDYFTIQKTLERIKERCRLLSKKNDIHKSLYYDQFEIHHLAIREGKWHWIYNSQIIYAQHVQADLIDHYAIRKEFFEELIERIDNKLNEHLDIPSYPNNPYKFESDNPHSDIAELIYSLLCTRVKIKDGQKGSTSKFVKEMYNIFGLDDNPYHERLQRIRNRKNKKSWLQELPDYINSLRKKKGIPE